ncbi:MAG TPA: DUF4173 domain-containing protein [Actinotalea sp.]|nr:DUF4173 domain-containing protein [Actinotalea sp.]
MDDGDLPASAPRSTARSTADPPRATLPPSSPSSPSSPFAAAFAAFWAGGAPAPVTALLLCGALGVLGGVLLVGYQPGLGVAVVGVLLAAVAVPGLVRRRAVGDAVTLALAATLVGVVAVRDAEWVVALSVLVAAGAGAVALTAARSAPAVLLGAVSWLLGSIRAVRWVGRGLGALAGARRGQVLGATRSVVVTVLLLLVFGGLFASADAVFASYLPRLDADLLPARLVIGALVAVVAATSLHLSVSPPGWSGLRPPAPNQAGRGEWLLPVAALDALVLAFVLVQAGALVGGHAYVLETAGLGYAQYAREGFAQLVVVTALTLIVVAVAARRAPRSTLRDRVVSRVALGVLCVGTLGVVASALRRMDLYVEAFGLTRLRLLVVAAEVAMAAVLVLVLVAGVRWRGGWLPRATVQVVAVAMIALAVVNPDALIVRHNTTAGLEIPLDLAYLQGLSADAVPAMDEVDEPWRTRLLACAVVDDDPAWPAWNLGRARALEVLDEAGEPITSGAVPCPQQSGPLD